MFFFNDGLFDLCHKYILYFFVNRCVCLCMCARLCMRYERVLVCGGLVLAVTRDELRISFSGCLHQLSSWGRGLR